ncbi:MAG TPA: hypothetical protein VF529_02120 [Solirubrobacteraceae bacterium]|jgi:hypothetical protein
MPTSPTITLPVRLLAALGLCAAALLAGAIALGHQQVRHFAPAASPRSPVEVGGLLYHSTGARTLDPRNPVDRQILRGIPAVRKPLPRGQAWFGVFLTVTNPGHARARASSRLRLVDVDGRHYTPQAIPGDRGYAYTARDVKPGRQDPRNDSPAQRNLAAQGGLVLFRIPRAAYIDGSLGLVITPPSGQPATMAVS